MSLLHFKFHPTTCCIDEHSRLVFKATSLLLQCIFTLNKPTKISVPIQSNLGKMLIHYRSSNLFTRIKSPFPRLLWQQTPHLSELSHYIYLRMQIGNPNSECIYMSSAYSYSLTLSNFPALMWPQCSLEAALP